MTDKAELVRLIDREQMIRELRDRADTAQNICDYRTASLLRNAASMLERGEGEAVAWACPDTLARLGGDDDSGLDGMVVNWKKEAPFTQPLYTHQPTTSQQAIPAAARSPDPDRCGCGYMVNQCYFPSCCQDTPSQQAPVSADYKADGLWLHFKSPDGKSACINVASMREQFGPIIGEAIYGSCMKLAGVSQCKQCKGTGCVDTPFSGSDPSCPGCDGEGVIHE